MGTQHNTGTSISYMIYMHIYMTDLCRTKRTNTGGATQGGDEAPLAMQREAHKM